MILAVCQAAGVVDIPLAIQKLSIAGIQQAGGKAVPGILHCCLVKRGEPIRFRESIVIQQHKVFPMSLSGSQVVAASKTKIFFGLQTLDTQTGILT